MAVTSARSYGKLVVCAAQDLRPGHGGPKRAECLGVLVDLGGVPTKIIHLKGYVQDMSSDCWAIY